MTESFDHSPEAAEGSSATHRVSRRGVLAGLGAAAGAVAGTGLISTETSAAGAVPRVSTSLRPEAVAAPIPGLTYIAIDAQQMWPSVASTRVYQDLTGSQGPTNDRIWAGLPLPVGSVIKQISVGYQTQPILEISRRPITPAIPAVAPAQVFQKTLQMSPGQGFSSTELITPNVTIEQDFSYMLSFFLTAGSSVFNASIGYTPPAQTSQAFFPFAGPTPRVLDTREPGPLTGRLQPTEERIVDLGITGARTAVINLTVTDTINAGFVAAFANGITWPGNSSVNWSLSNSNVANGVVVAMDATGKIKIRGGVSPTHVVIDRIGYFL